jgi:hypothetical protein
MSPITVGAVCLFLGVVIGVGIHAAAPFLHARRKPRDTAHLSGVEPADFDPRIARRGQTYHSKESRHG